MDLNQIREELETFWGSKGNECKESQGNIDVLLNKNAFVPFIGSGMSASFNLPCWGEFLSKLVDELPEGEKRNECSSMLVEHSFLELAKKLKHIYNNNIAEKVRQEFSIEVTNEKYEESYLNLLKKTDKVKLFVTTNFDEVIENYIEFDKIFYPSNQKYSQDINASIDENNKKLLIKLHGTCSKPETIVFTQDEFSNVYSDNSNGKAVVDVLEHIWKRAAPPLLFMGCGLEADELINKMIKMAGGDETDYFWHYAILEYPNYEDSNKLKNRLNDLYKMHIRPIWFQPKKYEQILVILKMILEKNEDSSKKESEKSVYAANTNSKQTSEQFDKKYIDKVASKFESNKELQNKLIDAILFQSEENIKTKFSGSGSILERIYEYIVTSVKQGQRFPLLIKGDPGTGKSIILSLLYYKCKKDIRNEIQPYIINTEYYDNKEKSMASEDLKKELNKMREQLDSNKDKKFIVLVDGINQYAVGGDLERIINDWITSCNNNVSFVLSITTLDDRSYPRIKNDCAENKFFRKLSDMDSVKSICLCPVENGKKRFKNLVDQTIICCKNNLNKKNTSLQERFYNYIERIGARYIDFRTVYLVVKNCGKDFEARDLCSLFKNYCFDKIDDKDNNEKILLDTAEYIAKRWRNKKIRHKSEKIYYFYKAESIRNYLFAYYYINILEKNKKDELREFGYILPQGVNAFLVALMNSRRDSGKKIIQNIQSLMNMDDISLYQKTQFAFMLGRIQNTELKKLAKDILNKKCNSINWKKDLSEAEGEYLRTIGISLIYLGNWSSEARFYKELIGNERLNQVNMTFHMRYYLTNSYRFENDFQTCEIEYKDNNIDSLSNLLYQSIFKTPNKLLMNINIITLLSLNVYKLFVLNKDDKKNVLKLITKLQKLPLSPTITSYVNDVKNLIDKNLLARFTEIYKLKTVQREGWIRREIQSERIESVAEHTWACCQLALIFLQKDLDSCSFVSDSEKSKYKQEFDLSEIIKMLVVHDLGEAYTGDKIGPLKEKCDNINEQEGIHNNLVILDTLPYFGTFKHIEKLFKEFTALATYNAKLAKDIDAIEPLIQLYIYRDSLKNWLSEFTSWKDGLKLNTEFGQNLLKFLDDQLSK